MTPKFRLTSRLISWLQNNVHNHRRLPASIEEVFFKSKEPVETIAYNLVTYAGQVHLERLSKELECLILRNNSATVRYISWLKNQRLAIGDDFVLNLKGDENSLSAISGDVGRLPRDLEKDIVSPACFIQYVSGVKNYNFRNGIKEVRIEEQEKEVFFSNKKYTPEKMAEFVAKYANVVGPLPTELKELLKANSKAILEYAQTLKSKNMTLDDDLRDCLAGDSESLLRYAQYHLGGRRLPQHLEKTMTHPQSLYNYAKSIVQGRLPEELENHLASDTSVASAYAFDVVRGFASVKLPEVVHSAIVMRSFENPNDFHIKRYIKECEKDTSVPGSW